jgi:hypothetical protein
MKFKRRHTRRGRIEIIPMIDTILILLIFYMTFSGFTQKEKRIDVKMPLISRTAKSSTRNVLDVILHVYDKNKIVVGGNQPASRYRHYDADFQGGGVFGFGTDVSLSALKAPAIQRILDKSFLGAEWRYNQFANGEAFQQYTGSVGFGW